MLKYPCKLHKSLHVVILGLHSKAVTLLEVCNLSNYNHMQHWCYVRSVQNNTPAWFMTEPLKLCREFVLAVVALAKWSKGQNSYWLVVHFLHFVFWWTQRSQHAELEKQPLFLSGRAQRFPDYWKMRHSGENSTIASINALTSRIVL